MKNVLILDQDRILLKSLEMAFQKDEYDVFPTADYDKALKYAITVKVDVLIMDYRSAEPDGTMFLEEIRPYLSPSCKIIVISTHKKVEKKMNQNQIFFHRFFAKPFNIDELVEYVNFKNEFQMKNPTKLNLFIIEDNPMFSLALEMNLEDEFNYNIVNFESGEEALENLNMQPNIVVLDYQLKGMNGLQTLIRLKKELPNCYVIALSETKDMNVAVDLLKAGAHTFIGKGESYMKKLVNTIDEIHRKLVNK